MAVRTRPQAEKLIQKTINEFQPRVGLDGIHIQWSIAKNLSEPDRVAESQWAVNVMSITFELAFARNAAETELKLVVLHELIHGLIGPYHDLVVRLLGEGKVSAELFEGEEDAIDRIASVIWRLNLLIKQLSA